MGRRPPFGCKNSVLDSGNYGAIGPAPASHSVSKALWLEEKGGFRLGGAY
jgi:hypothetical protein